LYGYYFNSIIIQITVFKPKKKNSMKKQDVRLTFSDFYEKRVKWRIKDWITGKFELLEIRVIDDSGYQDHTTVRSVRVTDNVV